MKSKNKKMDRKLKLKIWNQEKEKEPYLVICEFCKYSCKYYIEIEMSECCYKCYMNKIVIETTK